MGCVDKVVIRLAYLAANYLHGRSGRRGWQTFRALSVRRRYQLESGVIISGDERGPDGYGGNCIINARDQAGRPS
jgi:hypothetical protein